MDTYDRTEVPPCLYRRQDIVLATGEHVGHDWAVAYNNLGFRVGYVRLPSGHPWSGLYYDDIPAKVHGGLTYGDRHDNFPGTWIGFDCGHAGDAPDPMLPCDTPLRLPGVIRSQDYVVMECRRLCEQAAIAALKKQLESSTHG